MEKSSKFTTAYLLTKLGDKVDLKVKKAKVSEITRNLPILPTSKRQKTCFLVRWVSGLSLKMANCNFFTSSYCNYGRREEIQSKQVKNA